MTVAARGRRATVGADRRGQRGGTRPVSRPEMVVRLDRRPCCRPSTSSSPRAGATVRWRNVCAQASTCSTTRQRQQALEIADRYLAELSPVDAEGARRRPVAVGYRARVRRATTQVCCRLSGTRWRNCLCADWSAWCSPPRHWHWASICRRVRWCSSAWSEYNGEARRPHPGEFTQLTGRAGRRGIDTEGHGRRRGPRCRSPRSRAWPGADVRAAQLVHAGVQHGGQS